MSVPAPLPVALPPATTLWEASSVSVHPASILTRPSGGARMWMNAQQVAAPAVTAAPTQTEAISVDVLEATSEQDKGKRAASRSVLGHLVSFPLGRCQAHFWGHINMGMYPLVLAVVTAPSPPLCIFLPKFPHQIPTGLICTKQIAHTHTPSHILPS